MHIYLNHTLKKALLCYPKTAGSTIDNVLTWERSFKPQLHPNIVGWELVSYSGMPEQMDIRDYRKSIPRDYDVYMIYRDPWKRYVSGFCYMVIEEFDLFQVELLPGDVKMQYFANKPIEWYCDYIDSIFKMSNRHCSFNDIHTTRFMLAVWILSRELNATLVTMNDVDALINDIHGISPHIEIPHWNTLEGGYGREGSANELIASNIVTALNKIHEQKILGINFANADYAASCYDYNVIDNGLFQKFQNSKINQIEYAEKVSNWVVNALMFQVGDPTCTEQMFSEGYWYADYLHLLENWVRHGEVVSDDLRSQINNCLGDIFPHRRQ